MRPALLPVRSSTTNNECDRSARVRGFIFSFYPWKPELIQKFNTALASEKYEDSGGSWGVSTTS
jgi:hypothetical protein